MNKISAIIITKNEEKKIEQAVSSLSFCDEVLVIDDNSTDDTVKKAKERGAKTFIHPKEGNFAYQRNWAMERARNEWILFIDADEKVSKPLSEEMTAVFRENPDAVAFALPRRDFFWDKEIRYGETKKIRTEGIIRLVKKGSGIWKGIVHETFVPNGRVQKFHGFLDHYSHDSLSSFVEDINVYSTLRAHELALTGKKVSPLSIIFLPFGKFIYTYFFLGGFLDGPSGFVYSFVMSFHSFLVRAKLATQSYV